MAQSATPGWDRAMAREDWATLNEIIVKDAKSAATRLAKAWGTGNSQGIKLASVLSAVKPVDSSTLCS